MIGCIPGAILAGTVRKISLTYIDATENKNSLKSVFVFVGSLLSLCCFRAVSVIPLEEQPTR